MTELDRIIQIFVEQYKRLSKLHDNERFEEHEIDFFSFSVIEGLNTTLNLSITDDFYLEIEFETSIFDNNQIIYSCQITDIDEIRSLKNTFNVVPGQLNIEISSADKLKDILVFVSPLFELNDQMNGDFYYEQEDEDEYFYFHDFNSFNKELEQIMLKKNIENF